MGRDVEDVAILLTAMAGSDPADPATAQADAHRTDYADGLAGASLKGKRLGVLSFAAHVSPAQDAVFAQAVATLKAQGAEIIELHEYKPPETLGDEELVVLLTELKADLNAYLATTPAAVKTRTLAEVIAFNAATPRETVLFGQDLFEQAEAAGGLDDPAYLKARTPGNSLKRGGCRRHRQAAGRRPPRRPDRTALRASRPHRCGERRPRRRRVSGRRPCRLSPAIRT